MVILAILVIFGHFWSILGLSGKPPNGHLAIILPTLGKNIRFLLFFGVLEGFGGPKRVQNGQNGHFGHFGPFGPFGGHLGPFWDPLK